jgi:hypothetical protein
MTPRRPPRVALALLARCVADSEPLAGDLLEEFEHGRSRSWLWLQVLAAIVARPAPERGEIRPLRLVDLQPADAAERTRRFSVRFPAVEMTAVGGVGALGLAGFVALMTGVVPAAWWLLAAAALAGCALGVVLIVVRRRALG